MSRYITLTVGREQKQTAPESPDMTVTELKDALRARGLATTGSKAELEARLAADDTEEDE